jgi:hypothetical protein
MTTNNTKSSVEIRVNTWIDEQHGTAMWQQKLVKLVEGVVEQVVGEALDILDTAELDNWFDMPDTTDNWKTWKRIRNSISDLLTKEAK